MAGRIKCTGRVTGRAAGRILATDQPLSFWGGVDPASGVVSDPRHVLFTQSIAGRVLVFPCGKGSTGAPLVIMELARVNKAPAALVQLTVDTLLAAGPVVCRHFYSLALPVVTVDAVHFKRLKSGRYAKVDAAKGEIRLCSGQ